MRTSRLALALALMAATPFAASGGDALSSQAMFAAPLAIPHTTQLDLDHRARRRARGSGLFENPDPLDVPPGLMPLAFPRNSDMRARLLTPELKRTPFVGWIAENLYRNRRESGWCLEVDPGEGEYVVLYRRNLK
jgi:hypothetical protein